MTQKQHQEDAIIAEFMELKYHFETDEWTSNAVVYSEGNPPYHSSWDWLMEACKKFDRMKISDNMEWKRHVAHCNKIRYALVYYDMNASFNQLVEGIKWYNQNIQKSTK